MTLRNRQHLISLALIAGLALAAGTSAANPPPDGWVGSYGSNDGTHLFPLVVCSSEEKVWAIFDEATTGGWEKASSKAIAFYREDGSCQLSTLSSITVLESVDRGEVLDREHTEHYWSVRIETPKGDRFVVYKEKVTRLDQTTIWVGDCLAPNDTKKRLPFKRQPSPFLLRMSQQVN